MEEKNQFQIQNMVQWYEGQLLYPQHYQQMHHEIQQASLCYLSMAMPYYWGIKYIEIDEALLASGIVSITEVLAIMPDGSVVEKTAASKQKIEIDISEMKDNITSEPVTLHLAVIKRQSDAANTDSEHARYDSVESRMIVDENTGDGPITMPLLALRPMLLSGATIPSRYSGFPLMQIKFQDDGFKRTDFIPPSICVRQESQIGYYVGRLIKNLRTRVSFLGERLQTLVTQDTESILEYYTRIYNIIVSRVVIIEALYFAQKIHPFEFYKELCISAGTYCSLQRGHMPPVFDPYNHNNLRATFDPVVGFIERIVEMVKTLSIALPFIKNGRVFERKIKKEWLGKGYLVLGIKMGVDSSLPNIKQWLDGAIIASETTVEEAKEKRVLGASREAVEHVQEMGLLTTKGQLLVKVAIDGIFIKGEESLQVLNPSDTDLTRPAEIVLYTVG